jgi:hypothetical protein
MVKMKGLEMMDRVINEITDDQWKEIDRIQEKLRISKQELIQIIDFLGKYKFVEYEKEKNRVKIDPKLRELIREKS